MTKVTKTFLRSPETMEKYIKFSEEMKEKGITPDPYKDWREDMVKEFNYWVIKENKFPYDAVATVSHMLSTKRDVVFDWNLLNEDELNELKELKNTYIKDNYDVFYENLPKGITVPTHFHLHLIVLKREVE